MRTSASYSVCCLHAKPSFDTEGPTIFDSFSCNSAVARPALTHETDDQCVPYALAFLYPIVVCIIALFMALVALYYDNHYSILFVLENKPATISRDETCGRNLLAGI